MGSLKRRIIEDMEPKGGPPMGVLGWIPVSERLPKDNVDVLVRRKTDCGMRSVTAYRSSARDCWTITDGDYSEFYDHSVTHWMPLPEPPEVT